MGRSEELGVGTLVVIENKKKKLYVKRATGLGASKTQWEKSYQPSQRKLILQKEERSGASLCAFSWSARGCLSVCGGSVRREEGVMSARVNGIRRERDYRCWVSVIHPHLPLVPAPCWVQVRFL